ncbi:hemolysin [Helicobacter pullorum]|uniref:23S rRNA (cytidine-2'-O)-methyltransferase TlyA n=1 Tax=Helicobacter pullorum TaxID=35818 RepID=UPI000816952F|nr:TlyA family RNA methyltransferase [Helicobacter pullorum]OCR13865.1 hemolysin [Helicobacter pullorum]
MRLDLFCVAQGLFDSRNKAQESIQKGFVYVDEKQILKPAYEVSLDCTIALKERQIFVSRAGEKLWNFLEKNPIDIQNAKALDIGSSTGGFTQVLLQKGARDIYCVDVGTNQLHKSLRENPKIHLFEKTDIRDFTSKVSKIEFDIIVCDVSFIKIEQIFYAFNPLIKKWLILLFKPQYEVGREAKRNKKGVVLDEKKIQASLQELLEFLENQGLKVLIQEESSIRGKEGNAEFFIACQRS